MGSLHRLRFKRAAFKNTDIPSDWLARGIDPMIIFADASVTLPSNYTRPKHWPTKTLSAPDFQTEWHKWQANPKTYTPP
jgi:predicted secreted hydrolase